MKRLPILEVSHDRKVLYDASHKLWQENNQAFHLVNGLACGYPQCCILYFCSLVEVLNHCSKEDFDILKETMQSEEGYAENNTHTLCPECMIKELSA